MGQYKESISEFDFRILQSNAGNPTAILYDFKNEI